MGGSSSKPKVTRYYFDIHMGLGLPLDEIVEIKASDKTAWRGSVTDNQQVFINAPELFGGDEGEGGLQGTLDVMFGAETQTVLPRLAAMLDGLVPAFRGITTAFYSGLICTSNPYPKAWEVLRRGGNRLWGNQAPWYPETQFIWLADGQIKAMNPIHILYQIRTSTQFRGWPRSLMDDAAWRAAALQCYNEQLGLCFEWLRGDSFKSFSDAVCAHVGCEVYDHRTTGLVSIELFRDGPTDDLVLFDEDNGLLEIIEDDNGGNDDVPSEMVCSYKDAIDGKIKQVRVVNAAVGARQRGRSVEKAEYLGAPTASIAARIIERDLTIKTSGLKRFKLVCDRRARNLNIAQRIKIRSLKRGIDQLVVRVGKIEDGTMIDGRMTITVVQDVFSLPLSSYVAVPPPGWLPPDRTPAAANIRLPIEISYRDLAASVDAANLQLIDPSAAYMGTVAIAPTQMSLNYRLTTRVGTSGAFADQGIADWCPSALVVGAIARSAGPTVIQLSGMTRLDEVELGTAALINGEVVRVVALNTSTGVATIARGCIDTAPAQHVAGSRIWFYEDGTGADQAAYTLGTAMQAQLLTNTSSAELDPALAGTSSLTLQARQGKPYPPGRLLINGSAYPTDAVGTITLGWAHRDRLMQADQLIDTTLGNIGPEAGTQYNARLLRADTNAVLASASALSGTSTALTGTYEGQVIAEVWSLRDGIASWQRLAHQFEWTRTETLITDAGETLTTESGEPLILES